MKVLAFPLALVALTSFALADTALLDFGAEWCGPCRNMVPVVAELERDGYRVERINIDQHPDRMRQFAVRCVPTLVILRDGREVKRFEGVVAADELRRALGAPGASHAQAATTAAAQSTSKPIRAAVTRPPGTPPDNTRSKQLIQASARLVLDDATSRSFATGTAIRSVPGETLVLTCAHLFEGASDHSKLMVEFYARKDARPLAGELAARDQEADLAIVRVSTPQAIPVAAVASRRFAPAVGLPAVSVGCDNGNPATVRTMQVAAVDRYLGSSTIECTGQPVQGRSGGGLFNEAGELIGVCSAADPTEHRGIYVGLAAVQKLLDRQKLAAVYHGGSPAQPAAPRVVAAHPDTKPAAPRVVAASHETKPDEFPITLPPPEQIGLHVGEFTAVADAADAEVVCVIRPKSEPSAKSKVIVLHRASGELLAQLEKEAQAQDARTTTAMRAPARPDWRPILPEPLTPAQP
jgi:hypothetical protein